MKKYPSIDQFRNVIRNVKHNHDYQGKDEEGNPIYKHIENYPTLRFQGTVKLHGTNAAIVKYADGRIEFQSRERILTLEQDNAGFMLAMMAKDLSSLFNQFQSKDYVAIYGEWCGGNIQKGVAVCGLEKMFVIFGIKVDEVWVSISQFLYNYEEGIYNILQFPTYEIDIDFNQPEAIQNKLIELTVAVEECCPVGKFFGKEGVGEGIVFTCMSDPTLKFKSKGEKHSVSKVKVLNPVDTELIASINEFVESVVSENRLKQGLSYFTENNISIEPKNIGEFLRWIVTDVLKEETDTLVKSQLDVKRVKNAIVAKARVWFLNSI